MIALVKLIKMALHR